MRWAILCRTVFYPVTTILPPRLGLPQSDTGFGILTPFNAAFSSDQIVGIGAGGSMVLKLSARPVAASGFAIGVHAGVGMDDYNYPDGQAGDGSAAEPLIYTYLRQADVMVGQQVGQSINWFDLGSTTFDIPTNYFTQGVTEPGGQFTDGTAVANFAQPFTGTSAGFENLDWTGILSDLNGSCRRQMAEPHRNRIDECIVHSVFRSV